MILQVAMFGRLGRVSAWRSWRGWWPLLALLFWSSAVQAQSGLDVRPPNTTCVAPQRPTQTAAITLQQASGTGFSPTAIVQSPVNLRTWYQVNRAGVINRYNRSGTNLFFSAPFADFRDRSTDKFNNVPYGELGLLGLAFHPGFATNGAVFVYYSAAGTEGTPVEARLSRLFSRDGGLTLDMSSEEVLMRVPRFTQYHWGGTIGFGPDGFLYASFGDGGNIPARAQELGSLLGKFIRIDVSTAPGYRVPPTNPFVGVAGARPEVYALGLRNPWKWSFDKATGNLWVGDVGANLWEEVNLLVRGGNYGWPIREGAHCNGASPCRTAGLIEPIYEYAHDPASGGAAIIGGYVYSGTAIPALRGSYVFADVGGRVFALRFDAAGKAYAEVLTESAPLVYSFGQDEAGELYLGAAARAFLLAPAGTPVPDTFPQTLSATGCMSPGHPDLAGPALIPYSVNSPLWSDGATKERWFVVPDGRYVNRMPDGDWVLPLGSMAVKSFRLNGRLVETRLFVRHNDGEWAGYSYEWNDAQTDAVLVLVLAGGKTRAVEGRNWLYPSRSQCLACHTDAAGRTLGLETPQLNRDHLYASTGRTANQLQTLADIGMFSAPLPGTPAQMPRLVDPTSTAHGLEQRARSYLHANCSMCHRPGGPGQGPEDFRYSLPTMSIGAINTIPTQTDFGMPDARLIVPGNPARSIVSHRIQALDMGRMPPLGTSVVDGFGSGLIDQWIRSGLGMGSPDGDGDGFADNVDNCRRTANASQIDSDGDGIGNACDGDFNNDGAVNALDLALFRLGFGLRTGQPGYNARLDMNGDGIINSLDLAIFRLRYGRPVGDL